MWLLTVLPLLLLLLLLLLLVPATAQPSHILFFVIDVRALLPHAVLSLRQRAALAACVLTP